VDESGDKLTNPSEDMLESGPFTSVQEGTVIDCTSTPAGEYSRMTAVPAEEGATTATILPAVNDALSTDLKRSEKIRPDSILGREMRILSTNAPHTATTSINARQEKGYYNVEERNHLACKPGPAGVLLSPDSILFAV